MSDEHVLSREEVDALLKASQNASSGSDGLSKEEDGTQPPLINSKALENILETTRIEIEKTLTTLLRKKISLKNKKAQNLKHGDFLAAQSDKKVFVNFKITPFESIILLSVDFSLLHQSINLLYGGKIDQGDLELAQPGKVGLIISEKLSQLLIDGFQTACSEYKQIEIAHLKTSTSINRINTTPDEEETYAVDFNVIFDDIETTISLAIAEELLVKLIPVSIGNGKHREKDFWRTAIKSELMDSFVIATVNMPDVTIKIKEFMALKEGDLIPIDDPSVVYVCLNHIKVYRAIVGQANSKLIAKIVNQI